ncbi:hypothetical protein NDA11_000808 [Ustilago hordei]|uniref:Related to Protein mlo2 n=1 Tax=Ustilago hordei TaxID=120017 RepID=I2FYL4_USTHO|nr:uncharacterized protein UHO2_03923 [Ustilago hordei]KAJ1037399.1 hypothetical protein NDA10_004731 [Ustilago hordei]KAJ1579943.1 hypothetical protein NDA15_002944 [Ustilago hordei]KAJ1581888.1 hypothetical protein NDA12_004588 [Ustilago hordei]KAJ1582335.1 hypothetical protein NDA11_000808 [Ustilago hordei]KAJ1600223.1 hypothetical protein NDA14_004053 [Ustilago hordei]
MSENDQASSSSSKLAPGSSPQVASPPAAQLPDPSLPAPNLGEDDQGFTAVDLIAQQAKLEAQANEAIPFQFDTCTHDKGYIRQPVYACKTCGGGGVCAGCSVSCHAEHELVELFNKRKFRCDCGTPNLYRQREPNSASRCTRLTEELIYPKDAKPCTLRQPGFDPQNDANAYNHNFEGGFCYCQRGKRYDPEKEDETMFQCIVCEEWLHEGCTSLRPVSGNAFNQSAAASAPTDPIITEEVKPGSTAAETEVPLIDHDLFDLMICDACVRKPGNEILRRYAGARSWMVLAATQDVAEVKEHDGLAKIQVPTEEELGEGGGPYCNGRSWQIFGLAMEQERGIRETEMSAATDGAFLSSVAELARSTMATAAAGTDTSPKVEEGNQAEAKSLTAEAASEERREGKRRADEIEVDGGAEAGGSKRTKMEDAEKPNAAAQVKAEPKEQACTLPEVLAIIASLPESKVDEWTPALSEEGELQPTQQRHDIFLGEDFRDRICRCADCLTRWSHLPHVLEAEETYAPPSDPQASVREDDAASITSSTYDLGMAALRSMPREKMINSLHAYSKFRDALWEHLKPFAGTGKMVREEDVRAFFQKKLNPDQ